MTAIQNQSEGVLMVKCNVYICPKVVLNFKKSVNSPFKKMLLYYDITKRIAKRLERLFISAHPVKDPETGDLFFIAKNSIPVRSRNIS